MVVGYTTSKDSFLAGQPRPWLKQPRRINASGSTRNIDLAPDGKRLVVLPVDDARQAPGSMHLTVLLSFFDELNCECVTPSPIPPKPSEHNRVESRLGYKRMRRRYKILILITHS
jgi:hypothetical protein